VERHIEQGRVRAAVELVTPAESYIMAVRLAAARKADDDPLALEIRLLEKERPGEVTARAISRAFGTPKPTLTYCYEPELLNLRTFPTLMGYSSRIMAESWESNVLYFARLADELHLEPAQLNVLVPQWTRLAVENIFATHLEDWPALLRSLRLVGEDLRQKTRKQWSAVAE